MELSTHMFGFDLILLTPTNEWHILRGWHDLCNQQLKDSECQHHGDTQRHLLSRVSGQVEAQRSQERNHHTWYEQVEDIKGSSSLQFQRVGHIRVRVSAAAIQNNVLLSRHTQHLPLHIFHQVSQVSTLHGVQDVQLVTVVGPGAVREPALLSVEGEERHVHFAGALGDSWGIPHYLPIVPDHHIGGHGASEMVISTERQRKLVWEKK